MLLFIRTASLNSGELKGAAGYCLIAKGPTEMKIGGVWWNSTLDSLCSFKPFNLIRDNDLIIGKLSTDVVSLATHGTRMYFIFGGRDLL